MALSDDQQKMHKDLRELHFALRDETRARHERINPFTEDLFDWKERGASWCGEDRNVTIYNSTTLVGEVDIGRDTWIGPFCALDGTAGIMIGRNCSISSGCQILTHDTVAWALSGGRAAYEYAAVSIGDCCFLGAKAIVLKGVQIGDHCLIGAGSVVTENVPDNTIVAGTPARVLGRVVLDAAGAVSLKYNKAESA